MKNLLKITLIALMLISNSFSFGDIGHQVVALIAEKNLDSIPKKKILGILKVNSLKDVATWADSIKGSRISTAPWHYLNLDISRNLTKDSLEFYEASKGNILYQINKETFELKDPLKPLPVLQEDLKFLIHFLGDLHQPLHCSDNSDKGGNQKFIRIPSKTSKGHLDNLHSFWDNLLELKALEDPDKLSDSLYKAIPKDFLESFSKGDLKDWALQSWMLSKDIYKELPKDSIVVLPKNYTETHKEIVYLQLQRAGIRLSKILNGIFK